VKNLLLLVVGVVALVLIGSLAVSLFGVLIKFALYLLVGAAVVGGAWYLLGKARRGIGGDRRRMIR
jgi:hypothetical protein